MATWILIAVFATIALTALLTRILMSVNGQGRAKSEGGGGDAGAPIYMADDGRLTDHGSDGGDGGGDGGGGGGD